MKEEEIIALAKQCGADTYGVGLEFTPKELIAFARLIEAATREEDAQICESGWTEGIGERYQGDVFAAAIRNSGGGA
jgi:hypothetical protein